MKRLLSVAGTAAAILVLAGCASGGVSQETIEKIHEFDGMDIFPEDDLRAAIESACASMPPNDGSTPFSERAFELLPQAGTSAPAANVIAYGMSLECPDKLTTE